LFVCVVVVVVVVVVVTVAAAADVMINRDQVSDQMDSS